MNRSTLRFLTLITLATVFVFTPQTIATAQIGDMSITGHVKDPIVPDACVTFYDRERTSSQTTATGSVGTFRLVYEA